MSRALCDVNEGSGSPPASCVAEVFNGVRWLVRRCPWRLFPKRSAPWSVVYQQTQPMVKGRGCSGAGDDLRIVVRCRGAPGQPSAPAR